jgi:hypothetical protein
MSLHKETINEFTVEIDQDYDPMSPRDDDTPGCGLVMWGRHYDFPNDYAISKELLAQGWDVVEEFLKAQDDIVWTEPIWVYDHSGIAFKTGARTYPFADHWDSAQCGVAYVTATMWQETQGRGRPWAGTDENREQAARLVAGDVEVYGQYVNGEVYCYSVTDPVDGEVVESCCGYYGWESVEKAAREAAEAAEHVTKCNGTLDRKNGMIVHTEFCPLHKESD